MKLIFTMKRRYMNLGRKEGLATEKALEKRYLRNEKQLTSGGGGHRREGEGCVGGWGQVGVRGGGVRRRGKARRGGG